MDTLKYKIAHVAPFAPNRCGLYEAARDMARADAQFGNDVYFVDAGVNANGVFEEGKVGQIDDRGGFRLETCHHELLNYADIIIMHTGCDDSWLVKCPTPLIWVVHGRPLACFRPEQNSQGGSFSLYSNVSKWNRTKGMLYFWEEHKECWSHFFNGKDIVLSAPPIDINVYSSKGDKYDIQDKGAHNVLICDSTREDIDLFETFINLIKASEKIKNIKIHYFGHEHHGIPCWDMLIRLMQEKNILGDVHGRVTNMELVYRSMDVLVSPNKILTRTVAEALCCGLHVLGNSGNKHGLHSKSANFASSNEFTSALEYVLSLDKLTDTKIAELHNIFSLDTYYKQISEVYKNVKASK